MIKINAPVLEPTIFPDKTSQVWHLPAKAIKRVNRIIWQFESDSEIFYLCQLKDLLDASGSKKTTLRVDYLPYARQDKPITNDSTFALRTFARILNSCKFDEVCFIDGHSSVSTDEIDGAIDKPVLGLIKKAIKACKPEAIVFPDAGAATRYCYCYYLMSDVMVARKKRNPATGRLNYTGINGDPVGKNVLIVDDICDGGMTFILLSKLLYEQGASEVHLYITHGIFSKGLKPLRDAGIGRIFTKDGEVR